MRLTLDARVRYTISVNTRPVYIEGENGRRLVIVVSVLLTDLEEVNETLVRLRSDARAAQARAKANDGFVGSMKAP